MTHELTITRPLSAHQNPAAVYLASLSTQASQRVMATALNNIAFIFGLSLYQLDWPALRYQHTQMIRARLIQQYAPSTVNRHLSALRGVLKEAWRLGHITAEEYRRASDVTNIKEEKLPAGRYVARDELGKLIATCKGDGAIGVRDLALIAVLCATGMRRSEIIGLDMEHLDRENARLELIAAKGRKDRVVFLDERTMDVLGRWLDMRGAAAGPIFTSVDKHMSPLTANAVYMMLQRRITSAGITRLTPHDLRRTFVSDMLSAGVDIATVARIAGHKHIQTTARYDRRGEEALKLAAHHIDLPLDEDET